jgi:hypothetical protein
LNGRPAFFSSATSYYLYYAFAFGYDLWLTSRTRGDVATFYGLTFSATTQAELLTGQWFENSMVAFCH